MHRRSGDLKMAGGLLALSLTFRFATAPLFDGISSNDEFYYANYGLEVGRVLTASSVFQMPELVVHHPLMPWLGALIALGIGGEDHFALGRAAALALNSLMLPLLYLILRQMAVPHVPSLLATGLAAVAPFGWPYSTLFLPDGLFTVLGLSSLLATLVSVRKRWLSPALAAGVFIGAASLVKEVGLPVLLAVHWWVVALQLGVGRLGLAGAALRAALPPIVALALVAGFSLAQLGPPSSELGAMARAIAPELFSDSAFAVQTPSERHKQYFVEAGLASWLAELRSGSVASLVAPLEALQSGARDPLLGVLGVVGLLAPLPLAALATRRAQWGVALAVVASSGLCLMGAAIVLYFSAGPSVFVAASLTAVALAATVAWLLMRPERDSLPQPNGAELALAAAVLAGVIVANYAALVPFSRVVGLVTRMLGFTAVALSACAAIGFWLCWLCARSLSVQLGAASPSAITRLAAGAAVVLLLFQSAIRAVGVEARAPETLALRQASLPTGLVDQRDAVLTSRNHYFVWKSGLGALGYLQVDSLPQFRAPADLDDRRERFLRLDKLKQLDIDVVADVGPLRDSGGDLLSSLWAQEWEWLREQSYLELSAAISLGGAAPLLWVMRHSWQREEAVQVDLQRITFARGDSRYPRLAWNGSVYGVVWQDGRRSEESGQPGLEARLARVTSRGVPIGREAVLTSVSSWTEAPDIAWDGSAFGVVWQDERRKPPQVFFRKFTPSGLPQGGELLASGDDLGVSSGEAPRLAWHADRYWVAFERHAGGGRYEVLLTLLDREGTRQIIGLRLSSPQASARKVALAGGRPGLAVVWEETSPAAQAAPRVRFTLLSLTGELLADRQLGEGERPSVVWDGEAFGVAWRGREAGEFTRVMPDGRATQAITLGGSAAAAGLSLAWLGGRYHLAWQSDGEVWSAELPLESSEPLARRIPAARVQGATADPHLASDGRRVALAWADSRWGWTEVVLARLP